MTSDSMRVETMGTGHGDPSATRYHSSSLITVGGVRYLVDAGEPADTLLWRRGLKSSELSAIFITHMHCDHAGSLPELIKTALKYPNQQNRPLTVCLPEAAAIEPLAKWLQAMSLGYPSERIVLRPYKAGEFYEDGLLRVTAYPTRHLAALDGSHGSYALRLETAEASAVFTGDLRNDASDFPLTAFAENCDIAFCELAHYDPFALIDIFKQLPVNQLVFQHILDCWDTPEGLRKINSLLSSLPFHAEIAQDGSVYDLPVITN